MFLIVQSTLNKKRKDLLIDSDILTVGRMAVRDKLVRVTTAWHILRLRMGDRPPI
jgi:hypothetical protein